MLTEQTAIIDESMADDRELLARWGNGEAEAGEELFTRHFDAIFRFFSHRAPAESEELVQRTFLAAVDARKRFRGDSTFRTFLFAIARRQLLKYYAARTRNERITFATMSLADLGASAETRIAQSQLQARLLVHMRQLPVDWQLALELHYWEGTPVREISAVLEVPEGTVKRWMHEARKRLASKLKLDEPQLDLGAPPQQPK